MILLLRVCCLISLCTCSASHLRITQCHCLLNSKHLSIGNRKQFCNLHLPKWQRLKLFQQFLIYTIIIVKILFAVTSLPSAVQCSVQNLRTYINICYYVWQILHGPVLGSAPHSRWPAAKPAPRILSACNRYRWKFGQCSAEVSQTAQVFLPSNGQLWPSTVQ